jgi:hypothetical protein
MSADQEATTDAPNETVFVADNVDEFVQRTRWNQILDARAQAGETLRRVGSLKRQARAEGASRTEAKLQAAETARAAVEGYILEAEQLYQQTEAGRELWTAHPLAVVPLPSCLVLPADVSGEIESVEIVGMPPVEVKRGNSPSGEDTKLGFAGVGQFVEFNDTEVRVSYREELDRRGSPTGTETTKRELFTPVRVTREAYRATNGLVDTLSPGIDVGESDDDVKADYSDVLDRLDNE